MRTPILATFSLLATALACGAGYLARGPIQEGLLPAAPQDPGERTAQLPPIDPALLPAEQDANPRMTPVVKAVQRAQDSVVSIYLLKGRQAEGQGSGVILDENGLVITNWHVIFRAMVDRGPQLQVRLKDNRQLAARVLSASPDDDLALLQIDLDPGKTVRPMQLGDSSTLMIGETLIAIGNPQGHANTVTVGVLSAEDRTISVRAPDGRVRSFPGLLQTDAAINQGNSGGALLDITGKLIGINNAMATSAENIGFAIPVNTVKRVFQDVLLSSDNMGAVWLGMNVVERDGAVVVTEVDPRGPAARAGIRKGDRVVSADGKAVTNRIDYARRMLEAQAGQQFPLQLQRSGRDVAVGPIPLTHTSAELVYRIGLEVETIPYQGDPSLVRNASLAFYGSATRRVRMLRGVVKIARVYPDSPGAELGVREGDILLGHGHTDWWGDYRESPFVSTEDLADTVRMNAQRTIPVIVLRGESVLEGKLNVNE